MNTFKLLLLRKRLISKSIMVFSVIFWASTLYGQKPADFSGVWIQDNEKSDDFYKSFNVTCTITQTPEKISFKNTFTMPGESETVTRESSFNLGGKEVSKEEQGGINKESATWSADKKTLTTKSTRTVGTDVYGSTSAYSLSADGLVLTQLTEDINPFGPKVKQIFNKKK